MRVSSLHLTNFRLFEDLEITFPDSNVAVIIGTNGSGKSSILDAIAYAISAQLDILAEKINTHSSSVRIPRPSIEQWLFDLGDNIFTEGKYKCEISLGLRTPIANELIDKKINFDLRNDLEITSPTVDQFYPIFFDETNDKLRRDVPIFIYYQSDRGEKQKKEWQDLANTYTSKTPYLSQTQLDSWRFGLNNAGILGLKDLGHWLRSEEDWENEQKLQRKNFDFLNPTLEAVRAAIMIFFPKLSDVTFSNLTVKRKRASGNGNGFFSVSNESILYISKNGQDLRINQLSLGEKHCLLIIMDIARRLSIANPSIENPLLGTGIVMIDEIELHLHPQWQRNVLPALNHTFPNIQFIVTTHSPQVLSNVDSESVLILEDGKMVEKTPPTRGRDSNSILYDLMNVKMRPDDFAEKLDMLYELIDDEKLEEAKQQLAELQAAWGDDDSEVVRAKTMLELFED